MHTLEDVKKSYKFWSWPPLYDSMVFLFSMGKAKRFRTRAVEKLDLKKGDFVLDMACGMGHNFPHLVKAVGEDGNILGFDYSPDMLANAKKRIAKEGWRNIEIVQGDAAKLPYPENHFDGAICTLAMSVIPDYKKALKRMVKVVKPGKRIVIIDVRPFGGILSVLNPLWDFGNRLAAADIKRSMVQDMKALLNGVEVEENLSGMLYIVWGTRKG
ncbi:MAG: class I SAM-dependent methyltransferase [Candidatus Hydrothermarchaeales archaeon]